MAVELAAWAHLVYCCAMMQAESAGVLCVLRGLHTQADVCQSQWQVLLSESWTPRLLDGKLGYSK